MHTPSQPIPIPSSRSKALPRIPFPDLDPSYPLAQPIIISPPSMGSMTTRRTLSRSSSTASSTLSIGSTHTTPSSVPRLTGTSALALHLAQVDEFPDVLRKEQLSRPSLQDMRKAAGLPQPVRRRSEAPVPVVSTHSHATQTSEQVAEDEEEPSQQVSCVRRRLVSLGLAFDFAVHRAKRRVQRGLTISSSVPS